MSGQDLAGRRIFLVEDETLVALMIEQMVEELGGTVVGSEAGIDGALTFLAKHHSQIDVALLDVNLNGDRSYDVAHAIRGHGIPLVFATGYTDDDIIAEWRSRPVLEKPFRLAELEGALTQALDPRPA